MNEILQESTTKNQNQKRNGCITTTAKIAGSFQIRLIAAVCFWVLFLLYTFTPMTSEIIKLSDGVTKEIIKAGNGGSVVKGKNYVSEGLNPVFLLIFLLAWL